MKRLLQEQQEVRRAPSLAQRIARTVLGSVVILGAIGLKWQTDLGDLYLVVLVMIGTGIVSTSLLIDIAKSLPKFVKGG